MSWPVVLEEVAGRGVVEGVGVVEVGRAAAVRKVDGVGVEKMVGRENGEEIGGFVFCVGRDAGNEAGGALEGVSVGCDCDVGAAVGCDVDPSRSEVRLSKADSKLCTTEEGAAFSRTETASVEVAWSDDAIMMASPPRTVAGFEVDWEASAVWFCDQSRLEMWSWSDSRRSAGVEAPGRGRVATMERYGSRLASEGGMSRWKQSNDADVDVDLDIAVVVVVCKLVNRTLVASTVSPVAMDSVA